MLKLVLTIGLVVAALVLWPRLTGSAKARQEKVREAARKATESRAGVDDLVQCPTCGAYGPPGPDGKPTACDCTAAPAG